MSVEIGSTDNPLVGDVLIHYAFIHIHNLFTHIQKNAERLHQKHSVKKDRVHQMRIYLRRLRTQLSNFQVCFSTPDYESIKDGLKDYNQALAGLREMDVFHIELSRMLKLSYTNSIFQGLTRLSELAGYKRQDLVSQLLKSNTTFLESEGLSKLAEFLSMQIPDINLEDHTEELYAFTGSVVRGWVDELMLMENCLEEEVPSLQFHTMRIKIKGLRYTLEDFDPYCGDVFKNQLIQLRPLQDRMGAVHDRQMWLNAVEAFYQEIDSTGIDAGDRELLAQTIKLLKQQWTFEMQDNYSGFQKLWGYLIRDGYWERLVSSANSIER